jgi:O-antigen biosynthesis alpha-1,2-mannosyltransferase
LIWLQSASDEDIIHLMKTARFLVQASVTEGFGLAVAEAGKLNVPLVLSDIPVFRELAGDQASYFPVGDYYSLANIIQEHEISGWHAPAGIKLLNWQQSTEKLAGILLL